MKVTRSKQLVQYAIWISLEQPGPNNVGVLRKDISPAARNMQRISSFFERVVEKA